MNARVNPDAIKPVLQALLLADRVYQEVSGKKIIAGTFNQVFIGQISQVPVIGPDGMATVQLPGGMDAGCPYAFLSLTDVENETLINLKLHNVSKNQPMLNLEFKIGCDDRLATVEVVVPLPPISVIFQEQGTFSLDVFWNEEILGSHRIIVKAIGQKGG